MRRKREREKGERREKRERERNCPLEEDNEKVSFLSFFSFGQSHRRGEEGRRKSTDLMQGK